jgi:hypothetical protein
MKTFHLITLLSVSTSLLAGCATGAPDDEEEPVDPADVGDSVVHLNPVRDPNAPTVESAPAGAHLTNFGGPVLKNVHNVPVFWSSKVAFPSNLNAFYNAVPNSTLFDMLHQYSSIGRGNGVAGFVDNRTSTKVSDAAIHTELNRLFTAGSIPLPSANNYYPVHFPAGVTITASDGSKSCVTFCAYHGAYVRNGVNVYYGVIPDQGGSCAGGCGANAQRVNNLTSVASHELIEAVTDPAVGLATKLGAPLAWYDQTNGEIGDICNAQQGTTVGGDGKTYVVQTEFSNSAKNCVVK